MGSVAPFLIWLLCIGIAAIMVGLFIQGYENEGFVDASNGRQTGISITTCPSGSATYITPAGNTNCCNGDIVNNKCNGTDMCTLSPSVQGGLQTCAEWISKEWINRSTKFCGGTMPHYFGNLERTPGLEGCSASSCTSDGSGPQDPSQEKCKIYGNLSDELSNLDSCYNMNALEQITCPQADAKKLMNKFGTNLPVIFNCTYIPRDGSTNGMPTSCYDAERAIIFIRDSPYMNADQKDPVIATIRAKSDKNFCNYVKPVGVGWTMTIAGGAKIPVEQIISMSEASYYFAQNGDKIILLDMFNKDNKFNTGFIVTGKLSDHKITTWRDIEPFLQKLISTLQRIGPNDGYSISKD